VVAVGAAASSASAEPEDCPRLDGLPVRELADGRRIAEASSRAARLRGLARLDAMPTTVALQLPRCRSVHTVGMRFALDLVWLDRAGKVLRIDREVPPRRLRTCLRARSVVEAKAGEADAFLAADLVAHLEAAKGSREVLS